MYRKTVSTVMLVLFVTSMLVLAIKIQPIWASETVIITSYGTISASAKTDVGLGYGLNVSATLENQRARAAVVTGANIGIYWDRGCTQEVSSISWGTLTPGEAQDAIVYVRNEGNDTTILDLTTGSWQPGNAYQWLNFSWSWPSNASVGPGQVVKVAQMLHVAPDFAGGFSSFSFNIVFQGGSYLLGDINHDGVVDFQDLAIIAAAYGSTPGSPNWNAQADVNKDGVVNLLDFIIVEGEFGGSYLLGDINHDGRVDLHDLAIIAAAYDSTPGDPKWNPAADLNKDGVVNLHDLMIVAEEYGETSIG